MIEELLKKIKPQDDQAEEALREIYINYGNRILYLANKITNDKFLAEEVLNDILFKIWNNAKMLSNLNNPLAYITTMTYNKAIDIKRKQKELLKDDLTYIIDKLTFDQFVASDAISKLDLVLESLSEIERTILILKDAYNYPLNSISKIVNLTYKQTRARYLKAFEKSKKYIEKWENNN